MNRKACLLHAASSFLLLLSFGSAHAQFTAYADVTVQQLSGIQSSPVLSTFTPGPCTGSNTANCTQFNNSVHPIGFTGGASYDFKTFGPVTLGADVRGIIMSDKRGAQTLSTGSGTRIYSALGGVKASFNTPVRSITPYVEAAAGYARTNFGVLGNSATVSTTATPTGIPLNNALEYHAFAGMDLHFLPFASWRVFEAGIGALQATGNYSHTYPLYSVSSGIVFHIPPRQ